MSLPLRAFALLLPVSLASAARGQEREESAKISSYPPIYVGYIRDAMRAFAARDFDAALSLVNKADSTFQVTPVALNVRGAVAIEQRNFAEGREFAIRRSSSIRASSPRASTSAKSLSCRGNMRRRA